MKTYICILLLFSANLFAQNNFTGKRSLILQESKSTIGEIKTQTMVMSVVPAKKNGALAVLYSLILPGMGELYAGSYNSGKYFTMADAAAWGVFAGFNIYGNWKKDNYKSFAASFGNIKPEGKDADFYASLGDYVSLDEYNRNKDLAGKFDERYNDTKGYYWKWTDDSQRKEYRNMWVSSEQSFNNVRFAVGALIVNRIISAINSARLVGAYNRSISTAEADWNIYMGVNPDINASSNVTLNFQKSF